MVFSLAGASSTGKTTQIEMFRLIPEIGGKAVVIHPEYPRILYERKYKDKFPSFNDVLQDSETALVFQLQCCEEALDVLKKAYNDPDHIHIIDGSVISCMVYLCLNYSNALPEHQSMYGPQFINMMEKLENSVHMIDKVIRLHPFNVEMMSTVVDDGFRPSTYTHRRFFELKLFDMVCAMVREKCNNIYSDDKTVRFKEIVDTINYTIKYNRTMDNKQR